MSKITKSNSSGLPAKNAAEAPNLMHYASGTSSATSPSAAQSVNPNKFYQDPFAFSSKTLLPAATPLPGLELIRGLACLQVFFSHIFVVLMLHSRVIINPSYWKLAILDWSYQSVMVFFVLSGYVIAHSQHRKKQDFIAFMRSRFRRLEPLYLVALALSFGLEAYFYPPRAYDMLVGHLIFVQGSSLAPVFSTNTPLWSLSYEFFFYLAFAWTIGSNQKILNLGWFCLGLGAMALNLAGINAPGMLGYFQSVLSLSTVWLIGVFVVDRPYFCARAGLMQKFMLFGMLPLATHALPFLGAPNSPAHSLIMGLLIAPLLYAVAQPEPAQSNSRPVIWGVLFGLYFTFAVSFLTGYSRLNHRTETIFALVSPFLFLCLVPGYRLFFGSASFFTTNVKRTSLFLGKMSYAIYIIHFPLLLALGAVMHDPVLQVAADILLVFPLAWLLTYYLDPVLGNIFDHIWPPASKSDMAIGPVSR